MTAEGIVDKNDIRQPQPELTINAALFGMSTNAQNNAKAFAAALCFCKENSIGCLKIDPGVYRFEIIKSFELCHISNFEILAPGVRFVFYSPIPNTEQITFFYMEDCHKIKFSGLSVDWDNRREPLASVVRVEKVTKDYVEFLCMEDWDIPDTSLFVSLNAVNPTTYTPGVEGGREYNIDGNQRESFLKRERLGEKRYRCYFKRGASGETVFTEGGCYLIRHYMYNGGIFLICHCTHITFEDFSVYGSPGSGFDVRGRSSYFYFHRLCITVPDYETRHISTTVDAVFLAGTDGHMLFEDCDIGYQGDDGINIHNGSYRGGKRVPGEDNAIVLRAPSFRLGDTLSFAKADLTPMGFSAKIMDKQPVGDAHKFILDKQIPKQINSESLIYNISFDSSNFAIKNCRFHENRARGILVQADDGLIENCEFYHIQGAAIQIETGVSAGWCEGRGVRKVKIKNNRMIGCDVNDWGKGVVYMSTYVPDGIPIQNSDYPNPTSTVGDASGASFRTDYPLFRDITIEGNVVEEYPRRAMILTSVDGLLFQNNTFINNQPRRENSPDRGSVLVAYGKNVVEANNLFQPSPYMLMPLIDNRSTVL